MSERQPPDRARAPATILEPLDPARPPATILEQPDPARPPATILEQPDPALLRATILELLAQRDPGKTICPSEAARALAGERFRPLMEPVRDAAAALVDEGQIEVTQRGAVVDPRRARGPIRLRLRRD